MSLGTPAARIGCGGHTLGTSLRPFSWTNLAGSSVASGPTLLKTGADSWDSGGQADRALLLGDGFVEYTVTDAASLQMVGFSTLPASGDYTKLEWAWYVAFASIWESGAPTGAGNPDVFVVGDRISVGVEAGVVVYRHNDAPIYTSLVPPIYPLHAVVAQYSSGAQVGAWRLGGDWR